MNYSIVKDTVRNSKGLRIAVEVYKPNGVGVFPMVLIFHGFTGYKEENNLVDISQRLAAVGIASLRFTASGFGDSEGSLESDYRFGAFREEADAVYEYLQKLPYVDVHNVGVCGHSMGGKLAVLFCADHEEVRAVCAISAPVHLLSTSFGVMQDEWKRLGYYEKISGRDGKVIRIPFAYITEAEDSVHDVLRAAKRVVRSNALIIAGRADQTVSWEASKQIFDSLGCFKEWLLLEGVDHWYKKKVEQLAVVHQPVVTFFEKYLIS